jgi:hypothetical protein
LYVTQFFFALRSGRPRAHSPLPRQPFTHQPVCTRPFTSRQQPTGPPRTEGGLHTPRAEGTGSFSRRGERRESLLGRRDLGRCPRSVRLEFRPQAFARTAPAPLPKPPDRDKKYPTGKTFAGWVAIKMSRRRSTGPERSDQPITNTLPLNFLDVLYMPNPPSKLLLDRTAHRRDPCDTSLESP